MRLCDITVIIGDARVTYQPLKLGEPFPQVAMVGKEKPEARKLQVNRNNRNISLIIEEYYSREENTQTISELPGFNYSLIS